MNEKGEITFTIETVPYCRKCNMLNIDVSTLFANGEVLDRFAQCSRIEFCKAVTEAAIKHYKELHE